MSEGPDFQDIYSTYYGKIVRYLARMVGEANAEDVAQEVFVKVSAALGGFRGDSRISTWLYRIAANAAVDHLRGNRDGRPFSGAGAQGEDVSDDYEGDLQDSAPLLDTLLIRKDMNECIQGIVHSLPDSYRNVLVLSDLEGLTNVEIGYVLGISLETVKIRLYRGRMRLKKELETHCRFYRDDRNELACDRKMIIKM